MQHLALYRKYRPKTFDEVIGQDHIVKTLINQINNNSISHAYLFCGPRGNGKTSCAKIFARAINCLNPVNGSPCNQCENCKSSNEAGNLDIVEIDAASNNRVEEIRDIREKINFVPTNGKYKVYIVDEVHMLTDSAFNALLKTLEEPPSYAVFILCTTEVYKLPATILSRCTRFDFKLISIDDLTKHLKKVFDDSGIKYDNESLELIAKAGQGSVRDTLSVAEMCTAFCNNNINYEEVVKCLGLTSNEVLYKITKFIINKDASNLLVTLDELYRSGKNLNLIMKDLGDYMNNVLKVKLISNARELLNYTKEDYDKLSELASMVDTEFMIKCMEKLSQKETSIKTSLNPNILVQTTLLGLVVENNEIEDIKSRLQELEKKTKNEGVTDNFAEKKTANVGSSLNFEVIKQDLPVSFDDVSVNKQTINAKQLFGEICKYLKDQKNFMMYSACGGVKNVEIIDDEFVIFVDKDDYGIFNSNRNLIANFVETKNCNLKVNIKIAMQNEQNVDIIDLVKKIFGDNIEYINK